MLESVSTATFPVRPFAFRRNPAPDDVPLAPATSLPERDPYRRPWPGREVTSGGVTLHVRETPGPDDVPAVYVHGLAGSATNWTDLSALLSSLGGGQPHNDVDAGSVVNISVSGGTAHVFVDDNGTANGGVMHEVATLTNVGVGTVINILYDDQQPVHKETVS